MVLDLRDHVFEITRFCGSECHLKHYKIDFKKLIPNSEYQEVYILIYNFDEDRGTETVSKWKLLDVKIRRGGIFKSSNKIKLIFNNRNYLGELNKIDKRLIKIKKILD